MRARCTSSGSCRHASGASWRFRSLPAGLVGYVPVRIVRAPSFGDAAILILAAIAYTSFAVAFFGRGLQRYASGSGFTMFG